VLTSAEEEERSGLARELDEIRGGVSDE